MEFDDKSSLGKACSQAEVLPSNVSDQAAIAMAQASVDRCLNENESPDDGGDLAELSAALELLGELNIGPLGARDADGVTPLKLGRFEVYGEQGRGGFGIVLRAFDPLLQRAVALKVPRPDRLLAGQPPDNFVREARIAASLDHPGIVKVYETRRLGPVWYIASAYCDGPTLNAWVAERNAPLAPRDAVQILAEIADAVSYAHSRGVLHLDLKPENILLAPAGSDRLPQPQVTDFGLSSPRDPQASTAKNRVAGTFAYMAPEQRLGQTAELGVAADVYALGAILHDLLSGALNASAATLSSETKAPADRQYPSPPNRGSLLAAPSDLDAVCRKCLCDDPNLRYASATDLASDLRRFLQHEPVTARTAPWPERTVRWARRRPAVAVLCGLLATTVCLSLAAMTYLWRQAEDRLASLRAEQATRAEIADRMRQSLLNLAWIAQENRLQSRSSPTEPDKALEILQGFYQDMIDWQDASSNGDAMAKAVQAARHSLAVAGGAPNSDRRRRDEEFAAGLKAWRAVLDAEPNRPEWRRAIALHALTYAVSFPSHEWVWWDKNNLEMAPVDEATRRYLEEPYAHLLIEFAGKRTAFRDNALAFHMLSEAIPLLESIRNGNEADEERTRALLTAYNALAEAARAVSAQEESHRALTRAEELASLAPPPAECSPQSARVVGETYRIRAHRMKRDGAPANALPAFRLAAEYIERSVEAIPNDAGSRLVAANIRRQVAEFELAGEQPEKAINEYRIAVDLVREGLIQTPCHRGLLQSQAKLEWLLARCLLDSGDEQGALTRLESAAKAFEQFGLRNDDVRTVWMQSIRVCQTLGQVYASQGRTNEAATAYRKSLELLEEIRPRRSQSPEFKESVVLSREALARLSVRLPTVTPTLPE